MFKVLKIFVKYQKKRVYIFTSSVFIYGFASLGTRADEFSYKNIKNYYKKGEKNERHNTSRRDLQL